MITWHDTDEVLTHLPRNVSHDHMPRLQLNTELCVCQSFDNVTFNFDGLFFGHKPKPPRITW